MTRKRALKWMQPEELRRISLGAAAVAAEATEGSFTSLTVNEADATADANAEGVQLGADEGDDAYDPESWEGEDDSYESDF